MPLYLAYDGSVNGDWVAHYAVSFARANRERRLHVVHTETTDISGRALAEKFDSLKAIAEHAQIDIDIEIHPMRHGVFGGLMAVIPPGAETTLVCGLRSRAGRRGLLTGTVSEQLLREQAFMTVAIRVVQPGLLGAAHRVLIPIAGAPPGIHAAHAFLKLLGPVVNDLRFLHVVRVGAFKFRRLSAEKAGALRHQASDYLQKVTREITEDTDFDGLRVDRAVRLSDDWVKEVLIDAGRARADLIAMEAVRASLSGPLTFGDPMEVILRDSRCDVALFRGLRDDEGAR